MIMLYVLLIERGIRTLEQVPAALRVQVQEAYNSRNKTEGGI